MTFVFNFRVSACINADSIDEARQKWEDLELGDGVEFVELIEVYDEDTYEDVTDEM